MQVKKEDLRECILDKATEEFLKRGYKEASMRTIAKKAHTTLGNIYNYFKSKEQLLDAVVGELPDKLERLLENQDEHEKNIKDDKEIDRLLDEIDPRVLGIDIFLNKKFVILMEGCEHTKHEKYREKLLELGKKHVLEHMKEDKSYEKFAEIMAMTFFNGMLFIAKTASSLEEAQANFLKLYKLVCIGLIHQYEREGKSHD